MRMKKRGTKEKRIGLKGREDEKEERIRFQA